MTLKTTFVSPFCTFAVPPSARRQKAYVLLCFHRVPVTRKTREKWNFLEFCRFLGNLQNFHGKVVFGDFQRISVFPGLAP